VGRPLVFWRLPGARRTSMRHSARAVHHVRGRIRLKIPASKGDLRLLDEIKQTIAPLEGVRRVETSPSTGSVVVHYDPSMHDSFHEQLAKHAENAGAFCLVPPELSEVDELAKKIEQEAEFLSQHSEAARKIVDGFKSLDTAIKVATGNAVDLKVLLPLGLAVYSFVEIGLEASTPLWVTLGIFSFNSFLTLHAPDPQANTTTAVVVGSGSAACASAPPATDAARAPSPQRKQARTRKAPQS
jgi:cation transport ATPase